MFERRKILTSGGSIIGYKCIIDNISTVLYKSSKIFNYYYNFFFFNKAFEEISYFYLLYTS